MSPEMESISRVRSLVSWLRKTGKQPTSYPKLSAMTETEVREAKYFASGIYPMPVRWTRRLFELARQD